MSKGAFMTPPEAGAAVTNLFTGEPVLLDGEIENSSLLSRTPVQEHPDVVSPGVDEALVQDALSRLASDDRAVNRYVEIDRLTETESFSPIRDFMDVLNLDKEVARVYVSMGYIDETDLDKHGRVANDRHRRFSTYYSTSGIAGGPYSSVSYMSRRISNDLSELPVMLESESSDSELAVDIDRLAEVAGVEPGDLASIKFAEISRLCRQASNETGPTLKESKLFTRRLFMDMLVDSLSEGEDMWVFGIDESVVKIMQRQAGGTMIQVGEPGDYMGSRTIPMAMNVKDTLRHFLFDNGEEESLHLASLMTEDQLNDMGYYNLPSADSEDSLFEDADVSETEKGMIARNKGKILSSLGLVGFAAFRAAPLLAVDEFTGNPLVFAALDIAPIPVYVWGVDKALVSKDSTPTEKGLGLVAASASFSAPYAYLYANGENYPAWVNLAVAGFVATAIGKHIVAKVRQSGSDGIPEAATA